MKTTAMSAGCGASHPPAAATDKRLQHRQLVGAPVVVAGRMAGQVKRLNSRLQHLDRIVEQL